MSPDLLGRMGVPTGWAFAIGRLSLPGAMLISHSGVSSDVNLTGSVLAIIMYNEFENLYISKNYHIPGVDKLVEISQ